MWGKHNKFKAELAAPRDVSNEAVDFDETTSTIPTSSRHRLCWIGTPSSPTSVTCDSVSVSTSCLSVVNGSSHPEIAVGRLFDRNAEFTLDRDLGLDIRSKDLFGLDKLRYYAGVYIGEGRNTSNKTIGAGDQGLLYIGRVEIMPLGSFDDYSEADQAE